MADQEISIKNVEYTRKDYLEGARLYYYNYYPWKLIKIVAIIFFFVPVYFYFQSINPSSNINTFLILPNLIITIISLGLWFNWSSHYYSWLMFRRYQKVALDSITITAKNEGIETKSNVSGGQIKWEFFIKALENEELSIIVMKTKQYFLFPKRFFSKAEDIDSFRELVKANVPEYKRILPRR